MTVRIQTGATEPITVKAINSSGDLTGLTDLFIRVRRFSDGFFFDFLDSNFKASPVTVNSVALTEVSAANAPGLYELSGGFNFGSIVNPAADDTYSIIPIQTPGTNAVLPGPGEVKEGQFVDDIWTAAEQDQIRGALGIVGVQVTPAGDGELQALKAQTNKIDDAATTAPSAVATGSLLDRLANKDGSKTYDPTTDSLEATRDRLG